MLDELVCLRDVVQRKSFSDIQTWPSGVKCLIDRVHRLNLGTKRYIVTPDKEDSDVRKHEFPERDSVQAIWDDTLRG